MSTPITFAELGLSPTICAAVAAKGFTTPSPVQAGVIPLLLKGTKDIIGQAQTGTGKTAAFALPLLELLDVENKTTQAIVLAPTRELAMQVAAEIQSFGVKHSPTVAVLYGGNNMHDEVRMLKKRPTIVVGTPGRVQHHIRNKHLDLSTITHFVLDEADEMLNVGFREEIEDMLHMTPADRRVLLFSATMPADILQIARTHMRDHDTVKVQAKEMTSENVTQKYYCVPPHDKFDALCRVMEDAESFYAIVFCRTKSDTDYVASQLAARHLRAEAIHGDIDQNQREKILARFRERQTNILVATDVAARGIDIADLNFVVNYGMPENYETYTHRIGRTGRAGNKGTAITIIPGRDVGRLKFFEKNLKTEIRAGKLPEPKRLVAKKQQHLVDRLEHILNTDKLHDVTGLAQLLVQEGDPVSVVAALLRDGYGHDFDLGSYRHIPDDDRGPPSRGSGPRRGGGGYQGRPGARKGKGGYKRRKK